MTTTWYDPVNIKVNYVYDTINFNYDSNYVYPNWAGFGHWWYTTTNWYNVGWNTNIYTDGNPAQDYVAQTYDHMRNDWFLATTTNVYYQPNTVKGFPRGVAVGTSNTWDDGLIAWMLHYEKTLS